MLLAAAVALGGCGGAEPLATAPPSTTAAPPQSPAQRLAARVAAAKDARYAARYTLRTNGRQDRTVAVEIARDGSWRIDVPGGAHGGAQDVAVVGTTDGTYQCALGGAVSCVKIADARRGVPSRYDVRVHHPFTDWLDVLSDPKQALSVDKDNSLSVPKGDCFSVEPNAAALAPPMDPGIYCYHADGVLTGARFGGRTLVLAGGVAKPGTSISLPGPVTDGRALGTEAPPSPTPSTSP